MASSPPNSTMSNYTKNLLPINRIHSFSWASEETFSLADSVTWMARNWTLALYLVTAYFVVIHLGVAYMRDRPRFRLRGPMFLWNASLTCLYVVGLARSFPELIYHTRYDGFYSLICLECPQGCTKVSLYWLWVFVLMKAPELLDTVFVVLRKRKLVFLHWYHHCTVLIFTWYLYSHLSTVGVIFAAVNAVVHALMYFYYSLKALSVRIPRWVSMALTLIQLSQMVVGVYANYYVYRVKRRGDICSVTYVDVSAAFAIYVSYFVLFLWYFYKAYVVGESRLPEILLDREKEKKY